MKQVHMILQSCDGIGKSFIAFLLAQHFMEQNKTPVCIDTDTVHQTFFSFEAFEAFEACEACEAFQAKPFKIIEDDNLNIQAFENLTRNIEAADDESIFIIDHGADAFVAITAWMLEQKTAEQFQDNNTGLFIHAVIASGPALEQTMAGLENMLDHFPNVTFVVWLNPYFGKVEQASPAFENTGLYKHHQQKIHALVNIPALPPTTFGANLCQMLEAKQTFIEARHNPDFSIFTRQRLVMIWRDLNTQITQANL
ncbi:MAG: conjugal transfer protein TraL [Rhodospirillaceae bacterium]|nr:MAG: conjugal transfer protein TraL [Rhodospirillaceae bacterium]